MAKKLKFRTRSFGSEPGIPDLNALTQWVSGRRGTGGDLMAYLLERSLVPQLEAGIDLPCAGGLFYGPRLEESLEGVTGGTITGEIGCITDSLVADAVDVRDMHRDTWFSMPAPHILGFKDQYYGDAEEASQAIIKAYRRVIRSMRDAGTGGHVLVCSSVNPLELEVLSGKRVFFFKRNFTADDLALLLEYQNRVAIDQEQMPLLIDAQGEYEVAGLVILHPNVTTLQEALEHWNKDQVFTGGYCEQECETFWSSLPGASELVT